ncbi:MAG: amino acid ABC transporter permease [Clostridia bacterium]|nr:amino acid ABC transporter permease [Clostridia bacterium]
MFWQVTLDLLEGFGTTCMIFAVTLLLALPLGLIVAFGSMSRFRPLRFFVHTIVWIVRGTPLLLQLIVIFYGPGLFGLPGFDRIPSAIVAFVINYACYISEIYRGGIESIPKGQYEAAAVLGMSKTQTFFRVILMQVIKRIVPPMSNEIITLVKDTSLARIISVAEIILIAQEYTRDGLIWPLLYTGVFYLLFVGVLTLLFRFAEKKLAYIKV